MALIQIAPLSSRTFLFLNFTVIPSRETSRIPTWPSSTSCKTFTTVGDTMNTECRQSPKWLHIQQINCSFIDRDCLPVQEIFHQVVDLFRNKTIWLRQNRTQPDSLQVLHLMTRAKLQCIYEKVAAVMLLSPVNKLISTSM